MAPMLLLQICEPCGSRIGVSCALDDLSDRTGAVIGCLIAPDKTRPRSCLAVADLKATHQHASSSQILLSLLGKKKLVKSETFIIRCRYILCGFCSTSTAYSNDLLS